MTIDWQLPPGFSAGPVAWPHPHRLPVGPAMSFGYTDEVVLPIPITVPAGITPGTSATLRGHASWLVCEKICIPEEAPVSLTLPVGPASPDSAGAALIARARRAVPGPSPWPVSFATTPETITFTVPAPGLVRERIADVWFYPMRWGDDRARRSPDGRRHRARDDPPSDARRADRGDRGADRRRRRDHGAARPRNLPAGLLRPGHARRAGARATGRSSLLHALALALAGGLVLNAMPCVLPVLSVKVLALVRHAGAGRVAIAAHGLVYTLGVLVSFGVLAGVLIALRAGGEQIGWGFQLQAPWFVALLAYVLFAMALVALGRAARLRPARGSGPGPGRAGRLPRFLLHRRPRDRRRHAVYRAVHGHGGRIRGDAALGHGAADLRGPGARARTPLPRPQPCPGLAPVPSAAGSLDGAAPATPRVPAVRVGGLARVGAEPAGGAARCRDRADRARASRLRGLAPDGRPPRELALASSIGRGSRARGRAHAGDARASWVP